MAEAKVLMVPRCRLCGTIPVVRTGIISSYEPGYYYAFFVTCPKCGESSEGFFNMEAAKNDWTKKNESN